jgi:hypothetical protein
MGIAAAGKILATIAMITEALAANIFFCVIVCSLQATA